MSAEYSIKSETTSCKDLNDISRIHESAFETCSELSNSTHLNNTVCTDHCKVVHSSNKDESEARCSLHKEQPIIAFCSNCEILACDICWKEQHCNHEQADLKRVAYELRIQLAQKVNYVRKSIIPQLTKTSEDIRINLEDYMKHDAYLRLEITDRTKHLMSQLEMTGEAILKNLQERENDDIILLESSASAVREELEHAYTLLSACDNEIKGEHDRLFIQFAKEVNHKFANMNSWKPFKPIRPPTFVSTAVDRNSIETLYGYLQQDNDIVPMEMGKNPKNTTHASDHVRVVIGKVSTLTLTNNDAAYCIRTLPDGHAWVGTGAQSVRLVNNKGEVLDEVFLDFYPYNLTILNDLLLLSNGQSINAINNGEMSDFYNAAPFYAQGICRTKKNDILVCLAKRDEGKILRLDSSGNTLQKIQFDDDGKALYKSPTKVSESPCNGDICVADSAENSVIVVDETGSIRFTYRGLEGDTFSPFYVTYDSYGNILIGDNSHFRIHLVDKDGVFLQYLLTLEDGLYSPWGLDVDENNNLWVGTLSSKIWIVEYIGD